MQVSEILEMKKGIKAKLMAATSLLLVSAILLSLTTYAWFILSTAPEVTEMQTTAGANGSLEIALQSGETVNDIKNRVGDSSAVGSLKVANSTWGNVVDLSGNIYGLQGLSLLPARLNMNADGTVSKSSPLKMPLFGQDGRISELANLNSMRYDDTVKNYVAGQQNDHGVLVYADDDSINNGSKDEKRLDRQGLIDTTREQIVKLRTSLRKDLVQTMEDNQEGISIILYHTVNLSKGGNGSTESGSDWQQDNIGKYELDDYYCIQKLLSSFSDIQAKSAKSVRHALLACAAADTTNYPKDVATGEAKELSALYAKYQTLPIGGLESDESEAQETVYNIANKNKAKLEKINGPTAEQQALIQAYASVMDAARSTTDVRVRIKNAQDGITTDNIKRLAENYTNLEEQSKQEFSREITGSILKLFDFMAAVDGGIYVTDEIDANHAPRTLYDEIQSAGSNKYYYFKNDKPTQLPTRFYMLKNSGLFSSLATLAGDFESKPIERMNKVNLPPPTFGVDYKYYMTQIRASTAEWPSAGDVKWGDTFGFDPDKNTGCLQAVYNATSGLKAEGSVIYVITSASRVNAYGYAMDLAFRSTESGKLLLQQNAVDRVTGKDSDTPEGRLPSTSTTQGSGSTVEFLLRKSTQEHLEDDSAAERAMALLKCLRVAFLEDDGDWKLLCVAKLDDNKTAFSDYSSSETVKVTGQLKLYSAKYSASGSLTLEERTDQSIVDLSPNNPKGIKTLVYLDGDEVQNAFLTPDQPFSLSGSINLQFATDAQNLKPMEYTDFIIPKKSEDGEEGNGQ